MLADRYKHLFERLLMDKLPFEHIDQNMLKSNLNFRTIQKSNMDRYQKSSGMGLSYLYLRNDLYIELLAWYDLDYLDKATDYNLEAAEFIQSTFRRVIDPFDEPTPIFYGPETRQFLCDSDSIVLGVRYDEFNTELEDEEFKRNFLEKQRILSQLSTVLEVYAKQTLGAKLRFIQYNEASVMK